MSDVEITVRGSYTAYAPPQRATLRVTVGIEGPSSEPVYRQAAKSAQALTDDITRLHNPEAGPVTWWSSGQLRTWANRPWNQDGKLRPLVHHAQVSVSAKFSDFDELSALAGRAMAITGVSVERIEWALREVKRVQLTAQVRAEAVRDARARAQAYADALDLGPVRIVALADAGMLGQGLAPAGGGGITPYARSAAAPGGAGGSGVEFTPEDIAVSAEVDARFAVG